jgi:hypothetical protein
MRSPDKGLLTNMVIALIFFKAAGYRLIYPNVRHVQFVAKLNHRTVNKVLWKLIIGYTDWCSTLFSKYRKPKTECRMPNAECRLPTADCRLPNTKHRMNAEHRILSLCWRAFQSSNKLEGRHQWCEF